MRWFYRLADLAMVMFFVVSVTFMVQSVVALFVGDADAAWMIAVAGVAGVCLRTLEREREPERRYDPPGPPGFGPRP